MSLLAFLKLSKEVVASLLLALSDDTCIVYFLLLVAYVYNIVDSF